MKKTKHDWRKTREYRRWRAIVIRRDKCCIACGSKKRRQAHHLNSGSYFPNLRFDIKNGVTLCYECHMNFHCNFKNSYREKCTLKDFSNFLVLFSYIKNKSAK